MVEQLPTVLHSPLRLFLLPFPLLFWLGPPFWSCVAQTHFCPFLVRLSAETSTYVFGRHQVWNERSWLPDSPRRHRISNSHPHTYAHPLSQAQHRKHTHKPPPLSYFRAKTFASGLCQDIFPFLFGGKELWLSEIQAWVDPSLQWRNSGQNTVTRGGSSGIYSALLAKKNHNAMWIEIAILLTSVFHIRSASLVISSQVFSIIACK